jgi:WD40 repeat protein
MAFCTSPSHGDETMSTFRACLAISVALLAAGTLAAQPRSSKARVDRLGDPLPAGALYRIGTTRLQFRRDIEAIAVSPDGKRVAAVSYDTLAVWEVPGGRETLRVPLSASGNLVLAFTGDGKSLLCRWENELCLLDADTGKLRHKLCDASGLHSSAVNGSIATVVLQVSSAILVQQWDVNTAKRVAQWQLKPATASASVIGEPRLSPDGKLLATLQQEAVPAPIVCVYDTATGAKLRSWPAEPKSIGDFAFSKDGKLLAGATERTTLCVWDVASGNELSRQWLQSALLLGRRPSLVFADDGASVLGRDAKSLMRWDWRTGKQLRD